MKNPFVIEIGCEELPAAHCLSILDQLSVQKIDDIAQKNNLTFTHPKIFITPRRIVISASNLEQTQKIIEVKGPLYEAAFENNKPNTIAEKFASSHGTTPDKLVIREQEGKKFVFVSQNLSARFISDLQKFVDELLKSIIIERAMRWDDSEMRFSRPIRWILCIHGNRILQLKIGNVTAGNITYGPRFLGSKPIRIPHASTYEDILAKNHVIVDHRRRQVLIEKILKTLEEAQNLSCPFLCDDLLNEVTFLIEYPHPMICRFNEQFLSLPDKVISTVLQKQQRYFPLFDTSEKKMSNKFLVIANYDQNSPEIAAGNETVIHARLRDAVFFYEQDLMTSLDEFAKKTKNITFQEELGSMYDKSKRISKISNKIAQKLGLKVKGLARASSLLKADLASSLVIEFPSLEGTMGRIYAENEGIENSVAKAIEEHYLPRSARNSLPKSKLSSILSLADKIDTLYGINSIDSATKGNSDPYGLRRAAIAIIRILWEKELPLTIADLISFATAASSRKANQASIQNFIFQRIEQCIKDSEYLHVPKDTNLTRAVIFNSDSSILAKKRQLCEISQKKNKKQLERILELAKRIHNIAVKKIDVSTTKIDPSTLNHSESVFFEKVNALQAKAHLTLDDLDTLVIPGTDFFNQNMIMSKVIGEKNRRLTILKLAHEQMERVMNMKYLLS